MMWDNRDQFFRWGLSLLVVVVAAVYAKSIGYEALKPFDDGLYLYERDAVKAWWEASWRQRLLTPELGYPVPIPTAIYAFTRWAVGDVFFPHVLHGLNVGLHLANVVLVAYIAKDWIEHNHLAIVAAALWALHPICVESVAWLTNLKMLLYATSLLGAVRLAQIRPSGQAWWRVDKFDVAISVAILFALGCRPDALVIPAALVIVCWSRMELVASVKRLLVPALVTGVVGVVYLPIAMSGQAELVSGLAESTWSLKRLAVRPMRALEITMANVVWPLDLQPGYFRNVGYGWSDAIPGLVVLLTLVGFAEVSRRLGSKDGALAMAFAGVTYLPYAQVKPIPRLTGDTYAYVPLFGLVVAASVFVLRGCKRLVDAEYAKETRLRRILMLGFAGWMVTMTVVTVHQLDRWKSTPHLWLPLAEKNVTNWKPFIYAGEAYINRGEYAMAASTYELGMKAFRLHRHYSGKMLLAFERAGAPKKAWHLCLEAIDRVSDPDSGFYTTLLRMSVTYEWAEIESIPAQVLGRAVEIYTSDSGWMNKAGLRRRLALALADAGYPELAAPFVKWELDHANPVDCTVWVAESLVDDPDSFGISIPPRPERCEGVEWSGSQSSTDDPEPDSRGEATQGPADGKEPSPPRE